MAKVRVKPWEAACTVSHPITGQFITPQRGEYYADNDPLVLAHGWLFATDTQIAEHLGEADGQDEDTAPARRGRRG